MDSKVGMSKHKILTGAVAVKAWLKKMVHELGNHSDRLDAINIYPVADGDTGSNMFHTAQAMLEAVNEVPEPELSEMDLGTILRIASRAGMEKAHGNSGTLLAVFLAGFAEPLSGVPRLNGPALADALEAGSVRAWSALSEPVPGTILSVIQSAAKAARRSLRESAADPSSRACLIEIMTAIYEDVLAAVLATETQLKQLNEAHVVDAGAVGMMLVLDSLSAVVLGEHVVEARYQPLHGYGVQDPHIHETAEHEEGFEVMSTIELGALDAATLRAKLDAIGTSVIMSPMSSPTVGTELYRWRVHVHVEKSEEAIATMSSVGEPTAITVTELSSVHHD